MNSLVYAVRLLSRKAYFKAELLISLDKKFPNADNTVLIDKLEATGYFDDEKLLKNFIVSHIRRGHGEYYISQRLAKKGMFLTKSKLSEIIRADDRQCINERIKQLALKYISRQNILDRYKIFKRTLNYLAGRGFDMQDIKNVLNEVYKDESYFSEGC